MANTITEPPDKTAENGRDSKSGRFLPGNSGGPGRPRGFDLRAVAEQKAAEEGVDLETGLWLVVRRLMTAAQGGDVQAARLLLDRLCDATEVEGGGVVLTVVTGVPESLTKT